MSEKTAIGYARELVASLWHSFPEDAEQPIAAAIAAAEERGRRSGVEEADGTVRSAVRLALACAAEIADSIDNIVTRRVIARRIRALIPPPQGNTVWPDPAHDGVVERLRVAIDAALAPRDSAPECRCSKIDPTWIAGRHLFHCPLFETQGRRP